MSDIETVLVAVDDSMASEDAVEVAAGLLRDDEARRVLLFHVLPTLPTELLGFGGRADEADERRGLAALHDRRVAWMNEARHDVEPIFARMTRALGRAGVPPRRVATHVDAPNPECSVAQEILRVARERGATTIVVGRHAFPWYVEGFRRHVGEDLVHLAGRETVVVAGHTARD